MQWHDLHVSFSLTHTHMHTVLCCPHCHDNPAQDADGFPRSFIYSSISALLCFRLSQTRTHTHTHRCASFHMCASMLALPLCFQTHKPSFTNWFDHQSFYHTENRFVSGEAVRPCLSRFVCAVFCRLRKHCCVKWKAVHTKWAITNAASLSVFLRACVCASVIPAIFQTVMWSAAAWGLLCYSCGARLWGNGLEQQGHTCSTNTHTKNKKKKLIRKCGAATKQQAQQGNMT